MHTQLTSISPICMKVQGAFKYLLRGRAGAAWLCGPQSFLTHCRRQDELISVCAGKPQAVKGAQQPRGSIKGSDRFRVTPSFPHALAVITV